MNPVVAVPQDVEALQDLERWQSARLRLGSAPAATPGGYDPETYAEPLLLALPPQPPPSGAPQLQQPLQSRPLLRGAQAPRHWPRGPRGLGVSWAPVRLHPTAASFLGSCGKPPRLGGRRSAWWAWEPRRGRGSRGREKNTFHDRS